MQGRVPAPRVVAAVDHAADGGEIGGFGGGPGRERVECRSQAPVGVAGHRADDTERRRPGATLTRNCQRVVATSEVLDLEFGRGLTVPRMRLIDEETTTS